MQAIQSPKAPFAGDTAVAYRPAGQSMHATSDAELYVPVAQATQSFCSSDPVAVTLLPAGQVMHTSLV